MGLAKIRSGTWSRSSMREPGVHRAGDTAETVMPSPRASRSAKVSAQAGLAGGSKAASWATGICPAIDATLTIAAWSRRRRYGAPARVRARSGGEIDVDDLRERRGDRSSTGPRWFAPALFTSTSMPPNSCSTAARERRARRDRARRRERLRDAARAPGSRPRPIPEDRRCARPARRAPSAASCRDGAADARRCSGDDGHLARESLRHPHAPSVQPACPCAARPSSAELVPEDSACEPTVRTADGDRDGRTRGRAPASATVRRRFGPVGAEQARERLPASDRRRPRTSRPCETSMPRDAQRRSRRAPPARRRRARRLDRSPPRAARQGGDVGGRHDRRVERETRISAGGHGAGPLRRVLEQRRRRQQPVCAQVVRARRPA